MSERPDVSVIVVTHNGREMALTTLRSARAASAGIEVEWFVVDAGSSDGTADAIEREFADVRVFREANNGFAASNNVALAQARGRYVLLLNPDVEIRSGTLADLVEAMDARPRAGPRQRRTARFRGRVPGLDPALPLSPAQLRRGPLRRPLAARPHLPGAGDPARAVRAGGRGRLAGRGLPDRPPRGGRGGRADGRALLPLLRGDRLVLPLLAGGLAGRAPAGDADHPPRGRPLAWAI